MVLLRTTRSMLTWFGMLQDKNLAPWKKFASAVFSLINLVLIVILLVTSAIFAKEFVSIDLGRSLMAISQILAYSPILYMLLVTLVLRSKITALIGEIMMIFNSSTYSFYVFNIKIICQIADKPTLYPIGTDVRIALNTDAILSSNIFNWHLKCIELTSAQ